MMSAREGSPRMLKILVKGAFSGFALAAAGLLLLALILILVSWLPWLGYVFFIVLMFAFVALLNWAFS